MHAVDRLASHSAVAVAVVTAEAVWVAGTLIAQFATRLETVLQALVAALTLAMVFVIQPTQPRERIAMQR